MKQKKFRVYDNVNKKMYHFSSMWYCDEYQSLCFEIVEEPEMPFSFDFDEENLSEPMDFIGIKDKDGKEIYERDIVSFDNTEIGGEKITGEVVWNKDPTVSGLEYGLWTKRGYCRADFFGTLEVLGNTFENKETMI